MDKQSADGNFLNRILQMAAGYKITLKEALQDDRRGFPLPMANTDEVIWQYIRSNKIVDQSLAETVVGIIKGDIADAVVKLNEASK